MPRYPAMEQPWMTRTYGDDPVAWQRAKEQCREALYRWAREGRYGTYSELVPLVSAIDWPEGAYTHHGRQMGYLLGQVSLEDLDETEDRPVLSSLVVGQGEGMPSGGYWTFMHEELGVDVPRDDLERLVFWAKEFEAACAFYGTRRSD